MTAEELDEWLKGDKSKNAGWSKEDGSGESIGHESYVSQGTRLRTVVAGLSRY